MITTILTCEHATNNIPARYRRLFYPTRIVVGPWGRRKTREVLADHWGWDPGSYTIARFLKRRLPAALYPFPVSRLLIEGNQYRRKSLLSPFTENLLDTDKENIRSTYWLPHINRIEGRVKRSVSSGNQVVHIGIHTFTPIQNGVVRHCDIGILFDPQRNNEKMFAHRLQKELTRILPGYRVRRNYPYTGYSEGLTAYFRKRFSDMEYAGIEIEVNNKHVRRMTRKGKEIMRAIADSIEKILS